ncbi:hypothetical protein HFP15_05450 [Amycolatopsis sp. K13G38]|uniref:DUF7144 domain-containing protein n=1 Tax=Amycolatopsis acididurans TaxID=2724524 RepID=A0ABX1J227_9PSEU|nr:hypothetical protein [Amycolatopsis acididurans]NKQ52321.1 hypothetical protein [Amycolatopsis acididurans]
MSGDISAQGSGNAAAAERAAWLRFSGALVVLVALVNLMLGIVALTESTFYLVGPDGPLVLDLTGWGWVHVIIGTLVLLAGVALFLGATWARIVIVLLAGFNALGQLVFLSAYPLWSTIVIALDVLIIWSVVVHSREPGPA